MARGPDLPTLCRENPGSGSVQQCPRRPDRFIRSRGLQEREKEQDHPAPSRVEARRSRSSPVSPFVAGGQQHQHRAGSERQLLR